MRLLVVFLSSLFKFSLYRTPTLKKGKKIKTEAVLIKYYIIYYII